jgi:hypothetical protein
VPLVPISLDLARNLRGRSVGMGGGGGGGDARLVRCRGGGGAIEVRHGESGECGEVGAPCGAPCDRRAGGAPGGREGGGGDVGGGG